MTKLADVSTAVARKARNAAPALSLAAHLGRGIQRVATDAVIGRARSIPQRVEGLDAAFLSRIMNRTVTSVSVIGGDAGTSSRARLALTGVDVPDSVFVKMPAATAATRLMGEIGRLGDAQYGSAQFGGAARVYQDRAAGCDFRQG